MLKFNVPFFGNTPDNTHCSQASLKMILKYFLPDQEFSFEQLDSLTDKQEGKWTWTMRGLLNLKAMGFDIMQFGLFDYERFIEEGDQYLMERYGKEKGEAQISHSDIPHERKAAKEFLKSGINIQKIPKVEDIKHYLDLGYLAYCGVNSKVLNDKEGYVGHAVVIFGYDDDHFFLHDSGLPPKPNREISFEKFRTAWEYPEKNSANLSIFKFIQKA